MRIPVLIQILHLIGGILKIIFNKTLTDKEVDQVVENVEKTKNTKDAEDIINEKTKDQN